MKSKILFFLFSVSALIGCGGGLVVNKHVVRNYYLVATDVEDYVALCYHESSDGNIYSDIIAPSVFAVGFNTEYLIVKQHPLKEDVINKSVTKYFILPMKPGMDWKSKNGLLGPFTLEQFKLKRKELNISDSLTFTNTLQNLE